LKEAGARDGWNIRFVSQPAQSPDLDILDLGFFNSLKKSVASTYALSESTDKLMEEVMRAYENYDRDILERIWGHQYAVYGMILKHLGGNDFPAPHSSVRKNQNAGNELSLAMNITAKQMNDVNHVVNKWQVNEDMRIINKSKKKITK
jgi:hypothetical protein